jgi:hypothetical protein
VVNSVPRKPDLWTGITTAGHSNFICLTFCVHEIGSCLCNCHKQVINSARNLCFVLCLYLEEGLCDWMLLYNFFV